MLEGIRIQALYARTTLDLGFTLRVKGTLTFLNSSFDLPMWDQSVSAAQLTRILSPRFLLKGHY